MNKGEKSTGVLEYRSNEEEETERTSIFQYSTTPVLHYSL